MHGSYETEIREDGLVEVAYRLDVPDFYMEFYYDPFTDGEDRRFTYPVVSPCDVPSLAVSVQEPRLAEGFELTPITTEIVQDERGFDYRILRWSDVRAGTSAPVTVTYRKDDRQPSVASPEVGRVSGTTGGAGFGLPGGLPAILAVMLAAAGTYVLVLRWQRSGPIDAEVHRTASRSEPLTPAGALPRFCSYCGKGITSRDRYCAWCGEPTRVADSKGGGTF